MGILLFIFFGSMAKAQTLAEIARQFQDQAKQEVFDKSRLSPPLIHLIHALAPFIQNEELIDPGTGQPLVTIEDLQNLMQRLDSLANHNRKLALQIQQLEHALVGPLAKTVSHEAQLGLSLVIGVGVRAGVLVGVEDRGTSTFFVVGVHINGHMDGSDSVAFASGFFGGVDLTFERHVCSEARFVSSKRRNAGYWGLGVGTSQNENAAGSDETMSGLGLVAGLGVSEPVNAQYYRFSLPFFWLPVGGASGLKKLRAQQLKILEALSQFQTARAFDLTQDLESRVLRAQRRAVERGQKADISADDGGLEKSHPFSSFESLLHYMLEKQKIRPCDGLLTRAKKARP